MVCRNAKTSAQWFCRQIILNEWTVAVLFSVPGEPKHKQDLCYRGDAEYLAVHRSVTFFTEPRIIHGVTGIYSSLKLPCPAHRRAAFAEVSLFSIRSLGLQSGTIFASSVSWVIAHSLICEVMASKVGGSSERDFPRHPVY